MNSTADSSSAPSAPTSELPTGGPRLRRSSNGSVGGVALGLATFLGVEVKWVRLAFLASILFGGVGLLVYLALWTGVPDDRDPRSARFVVTQNVGRLVVAGIFALFAAGAITGAAGVSSGLLLPAALVGGGLYLLSQRDDADISLGGQHPKAEAPYAAGGTVPPPPPPAATGTEAVDAEQDDRDPLLVEAERLITGDAYTDPAGPGAYAHDPEHWAMTRTEAAQVKTRRRPAITRFSLGAATLVVLLSFATGWGIRDLAIFGPLVFLGFATLGFVASLFYRRPAWALIPVAFLSAIVSIAAVAFGSQVYRGVGEVTFEVDRFPPVPAFSDAPDVPALPETPSFDHGVGKMELDLSALQIDSDQTLDASLGVGLLQIRLPEEVRTELVLADGGNVQFADGGSAEFTDAVTLVFNAGAEGPVLTIDANADLGVIEVDAPSDSYEIL